ncbi:MAG: type II toxin-antitoxin system VapC family toxin [Desulfobacterales bacterium]|nr:type II toxin-antitoxin system VapC family toxin [Desulfobacterales bacterium]
MNYLLDTCVISELVKRTPDLQVVKWVRNQDEENLFLSVVTVGEIQKGISKLPDAEKKKKQLQKWLNTELHERFKGRILGITIETAYVWGRVLGNGEKKGIILPAIDSLIAAQGIFHKMIIVTRNVADMEPSGALLFNPWEP